MRAKFGNKKVVTQDGTFDSQREYKRWCELKLLQKAGEIFNLERQVKYVLIRSQTRSDGKKEREVAYIADFRYQTSKGSHTVLEDSKGVRTDAYIIKRKMILHFHGITVRET